MAGRSIRGRFTRRQLMETYRQIKCEEQERRARDCEVRETAWCHWTAHRPYAWEFWRIGFQNTLGKRVAESDLTAIPGYDEFAQEMACIFPEFVGDAERLWDFLLSPYVPMPSKAKMMRRAEERLAEIAQQGDASFEFGAHTNPAEF